MRVSLALLCLLVAVAGCGARRERAPSAGGTGAAGAGAGEAIRIEAPADGARLTATPVGESDLRARVRVRGRAAPGGAVFLHAGCRPQPCRARLTATADGTWRATLALRVARAARFVTIDAAGRRDASGAGTSVATVELVAGGPRDTQPRSHSRTRTRARPRAQAEAPSRASTPRADPAPPSRPTLPHDVLVIGDSLAEGMAAPLRAALPGWRVRIDALTGRPLGAGMRILAADPSPPAILALSLFTNDDPRNTRALESAVRATATRPGGCAVWSTIVRPPYEGVSYAAANEVLHRLARDPALAPGLQLVEWARAARRSPSLIAGDEVHATPQGYRIRALMYAEAIRACAGEG